LRLHGALRELGKSETPGCSSLFYCASRASTAEGVHLLPAGGIVASPDAARAELAGLGRNWMALETALRAYPARPAGREFFSLPQQACDPAKIPLFDDFDITNLHWTAGMLDPALAPQAFQGRPVVWTLHDMNPFTGGCHYSAGCSRHTEQCGRCPELGSDDPGDMSFQTWRLRMDAYRGLDLHIVCPSAWLAEKAKQSSLLRDFPVRVIPHAQPLHIFRPLDRAAIRRSLAFAPEELVLIFAAQSLGNERKGGAYLVEALLRLAALPTGKRARLILLGRDPAEEVMQGLARAGLRAEAAGHVDAPEKMAALYNAADAVLVPSLEDNSPNVICEALGCGTPVAAFAAGGIPEMLRDGITGRLAPPRDAQGLLAGILWADAAKDNPKTRRACRAFALEKWNAPARARDYANMFRELAEKHVQR
jgi:glycosyltransferase involved in cell wall biosynthesis